ncbi:hypothetical protein H6768_02280 [Candidatus Peribacteria bacterium]|nr:hypothetical protein [Candidatus Peribacteria bacterium]
MAASGQFLSLLTQAQMVHRPHGTRRREQQVPTTARIISFIGADREEKIGIFSTVTESHTQEVKSGDTTRNKYRKISDTELRIFAGREEARRSQEHAIEKMRETEVIYTELLTGLSEYGKKEKTEKESYLTSVVDDAIKKLRQKRSYHVELIRRYLTGSQE